MAEAHVLGSQVSDRGIVPDAILDAMSVSGSQEHWMRELISTMLDESRTCAILVCERAGQVTGFVSVGASRDEDAEEDTGEAYALYVAPQHWRQGCGAALLAAALTRLRDDGCRQVTLWALRHNGRARAFYEAQGFVVDGGEQCVERAGGFVTDEVRYRRALDNPS